MGMVFCPSCGKQIEVSDSSGNSFCPFCGNQLITNSQSYGNANYVNAGMASDMSFQLKSLFDQHLFSECIQICEENLYYNAADAESLLYKAMCLLSISTLMENYTQEAVQTAIRAKNNSFNQFQISNQFLPVFDTEMTRICRELLDTINHSKKRSQRDYYLSVTHDVMDVFNQVGREFYTADPAVFRRSFENCTQCVQFLNPYSHDAAKKFSLNRPYNYYYRESMRKVKQSEPDNYDNSFSKAFQTYPEQSDPDEKSGSQKSILAIIGFIMSFIPTVSAVGIILCIVSIVKNPNTNRKLAIAGIIIGIVMTIASLLYLKK